MQQTIKNKTQELLDRLSDQHMYYTPNDLLEAGYPDFLVERIRLEIDRNLADSISLPESEWADMRADQVQDAWDHFLTAIRAETRIPVSYSQTVIENAVEDVLDLCSNPRNYILDTLFRNESDARLDELTYRRKWIVLHGILADSILRYMVRKNLSSISREKAEYILIEVDKKLTSGFTPIKWAQHLEVLFQFLDNQVPSRILSAYFTDRGMKSESKQISRGNDLVSRSVFIEMMSEAGIYEEEDLEDDISDESSIHEAFVNQDKLQITKQDESQDPILTDEVLDETEDVSEVPGDAPETEDVNEVSDDTPETEEVNEVLDDALETEEVSEVPGDAPETEEATNTGFVTLEEAFELDQQGTVDKSDEKEYVSIADQFMIDSANDSDDTQIVASVADENDQESPDESPFDEIDHELSDENPTDEQPIYDASTSDEESDDSHVIYLTDRAKKLLAILEPRLEEFIVEIFLNDELEFYKHLENISAYTEWRMAGRYITRDVFDKNRIDLYSEPAVMFTDAVQEFFDQNEN